MGTVSSNKKAVTAAKQLSHKFKILSDDVIRVGDKRLTAPVANSLVNDISENYNEFVSSLQHDHQDRTGTIIYKEYKSPGYKVYIEGPQVIYDEFGTGDKGLLRPHPDKNKYNLSDYNSGPTIQVNRNGGHYWVYQDNDGKWVTSSGVPSGQFVYKALSGILDGRALKEQADEFFDMVDNIVGKDTWL